MVLLSGRPAQVYKPLTNHHCGKAETRLIVKESAIKSLIRAIFFGSGTTIQKCCQYNREPTARPSTPTNSVPHPAFTLVDEHPPHCHYHPPMTGHKTLRPAGGSKQQGQRFADDTNLDRPPERLQQDPRPFTYEGRSTGRDTFHKTVDRERKAAEREALKREVAKQSGAYVKPKRTNSQAFGSSPTSPATNNENVPPFGCVEQQLPQESLVGRSSTLVCAILSYPIAIRLLIPASLMG